MSSSESDRWATGADVDPVVVGIGDVEVASVLIPVAVGVAYERGFVMIMEFVVRKRDEVGSVSDVQETIVVILIVVHVAGKITVVNPDVGGLWLLNADGIAVIGLDVLNGDIADDDIWCVDREPKAIKDYGQRPVQPRSKEERRENQDSISELRLTCALPDDAGVGSHGD